MIRRPIKASFFLLAAIVLFHILNNIFWLYVDKTYLLNESAEHFLFSFRVFESLKQNSFPWLSDIYHAWGDHYRWHGVLVQYLTAPFYFIFGADQDAGVLISGTVSLTLLVFSVFGIGRILYDEATGCLAAFIVSMYPLMVIHSRLYMLDLPLAAIVACSIFLLLKSEGFSNNRFSIWFAGAAGAGLLIKFNFILFIFAPLAWALYRNFKGETHPCRGRNLLLAGCLVVSLGALFYTLKLGEVLTRIYECSWFHWARLDGRHSLLDILSRGMSYYLSWFFQDCINNGISFVFFSLFLFSCCVRKCHRGILWLWLVIPVLILAVVFPYANIDRYYMPVLPAMALISSAGIMALGSVKVKRVLMGILVGFACFQYFAISYRLDLLPPKIKMDASFCKHWNLPRISLLNRKISFNGYRSDHGAFSYPLKTDPGNAEILNFILKDSTDLKNDVQIIFIGDNVKIYESFLYDAVSRKIPFHVNVITMAEEPAYFKDETSAWGKLAGVDYVAYVHDQRSLAGIPAVISRRLAEAKDVFEKSMHSFVLLKEVNFSDGVVISLYKRKGSFVKVFKDGIEIYFRSGISRIYYKDRRISTGDGCSMYFDSGETRYRFPDFQWQVAAGKHGKLKAYMKRRRPFMVGVVEFDIKDDHEIAWTVRLKGRPGQRLENFFAGMTVGRDYTRWQSALDRGIFSWIKENDSQALRFPDVKTKSVMLWGARDNRKPEVEFSSDSSTDFVPLVGWGRDWRTIGFYRKYQKLSADGDTVFSGVISFSNGSPQRHN